MVELISALFEWLLALPLLGKVGVLIGLAAPIVTLHTYLNPPPKKKDNKKKYEVEVTKVKAEVSVKEK